MRMMKSSIVPKDAVCVMVNLQKILQLNIFTYLIWMVVVAFFLYVKFDYLSHLSRFLSVAVLTVSIIIESTRLYLGFYGNLYCRVPELAGFLMTTILMQLPLISFFLFNPHLKNTPTEITLHAILWSIILTESAFAYKAIKHASNIAKSVYFSCSKLS